MLLCLVFARLLFAPVDIGFAQSELTDRAEAFLPGWKISFEQAEIGWDWRGVRPWIAIEGLRLVDRADRMSARVPTVHVGVGFASVLGDLSISTVELEQANVLVTDLGGFSDATSGGVLANLFGSAGVPKPEIFIPLTEAFSRFGARLMSQAPALDKVTLQGATIEIVRGEGMDNAHFALPRFELRTAGAQLNLDAAADVMLGGRMSQVGLRGTAEPDAGSLSLDLSFSQVRIPDLEFQAEMPEVVSYLDFPVTLNLSLGLVAQTGLRDANFSVYFDEGVLRHPVRFPDPAPIRYGSIEGAYVAEENKLVVDVIELQAGSQLIEGRGQIQWIEGFDQPDVKMTLQTEAATIADIKRYWPIKTYPDGRHRGARAWVDQHMLAGFAREVRFDVDWSSRNGGAFEHGSPYRLVFDFTDIDTHYLMTMPPIMNARGRAVLTRQIFDLSLEDGAIQGMPVAGSTAHMEDIHIKNGAIGTFDVRLKGDMPKVLALVSHHPLNVSERLSFDTERLDGDATIQATIRVPLIKDVPKEDVQYDVLARVQQAKVSDLLGGEGITGGDLTLILDPDRLSVEGRGRLNGVPLNLYWRENLAAGRSDPQAETSEVVLSGLINETGLQALGVDVSRYFTGEAYADATFIGRNLSFERGYFSADTTAAALKAPQLAWQKDRNVPSSVTGTLVFNEESTELTPLVVEGEGIDASLSFSWKKDQPDWFDGDFTVRQLGGHKLAGTVTQRPGQTGEVKVVAEQLDAGVFLADDTKKAAEQTQKRSEGTAQQVSALNIALKADHMLLLNGEALDDVRLDTMFAADEPIQLAMVGKVHGTDLPVSMTIEDSEDPVGRTLSLSSPDAGQLLRGLGLFAHLQGGSLEMSGHTSGWGETMRIAGQAKIKDSYMVSQQNLGPAVKEGVVAGLNDFVSDGPVELSDITLPFEYDTGLLDISGLKANGPTLGMTMEGQLSAREDKISVNGVFVPAYGLNALLGKIPILGALLTGGDGKGVFAVTYRVKGQLGAPEFSVNPVSGLAPGFLRLLFEGRKGRISDIKTPADPSAKPPEANSTTPLDGEKNASESAEKPETPPDDRRPQ